MKAITAIFMLLMIVTFCGKNDNPTSPESGQQETDEKSYETGTVSDIDGNIYKTVKIGDNWWMAENLKVTRYRNGDIILKVSSQTDWQNLYSGAYCVFNNDENNTNAYGYLYNGFTIEDSRNIAPAGWHVPSDEEWKILEIHLGMNRTEADKFEYRGTNEGGKIKETGTKYWKSPNTGATNESGFSAVPAGYRGYHGNFDGVGSSAFFWSSTEISSVYAWYRSLSYSHPDIYRGSFGTRRDGFSVRCIKD